MNAFNRVVMVLVILVAFLVLTILLVVPRESMVFVEAVSATTVHTIDRIRPEFVPAFRALLILGAVLLDLLLLSLLLFEIRGPARRTIRLQTIEGGTVSVTSQSLAERLAYHLDQIADVINVKVRVMPRRDGVDLDVDVRTGGDVNVTEKARQVLEVTRQVVEDKMGLKLAHQPRVSIHALPYPAGMARQGRDLARRPQETPPAPPPGL